MKKYTSLSLLTFLFSITFVFAQQRETRTVGTFTKLAFRIPGKLHLKQGSPQKVELEGNKDLLSKIDTDLEGGRLVIEHEGKWNNWKNEDEVNVYVTVENINAISVSGSGDLIAETKLTADDMDLNVSGSGSLEAEVVVTGRLEGDLSGSGNMKLKGSCKNFHSDVSGSGRVTLDGTIAEKASFGISGSGKIMASGSADEVTTAVSGSGKVLAANLEAKKCDIHISGSGEVEINVKETLDAQLSGSGSVSYKGNPTHVNTNASGSGSIRKL